ncbi:MAG TPA: hypothetical protein VFQ43_11530 [Nitrososphaera sp.]|nr:hypothetical protein [Nitrososphaera sp.]
MAIPAGLDPKTIKKIRKLLIKTVESNMDFKAIVSAKVKGLRGKARESAWWKAIGALFKRNSLFREAARKTLKQSGVG